MRSLALPLHAELYETETREDPLHVRLLHRVGAAVDLRDYVTLDRRTLGLTRILLGFLLLGDLFHRGRWWFELYSDEGIVPRASPASRAVTAFSIFNAFGTQRELTLLFAVMFVAFSCLLVGYKTRIAQLLAVVLVTGMNCRNTIIDNAGYIAENLLVVWTLFLPLGDRFSADSIVASMRGGSKEDARGHAHVTLLGPVLLMQLAAVYYMAAVHKTGEPWLEGQAVHFVMHCDRMIRPVVALVRDHVPNGLVRAMTYGALIMEASLPFVLLSPFFRTWSRRLSLAMIVGLHVGFGVMLALGPFSWTMCVFASLLVSAADWELVARAMRRQSRARTVVFDGSSARAVFVCRLLRELDGLDLLKFRSGEPGPLGLAIVSGTDTVRRPSAMLRDVLTALPLGPILALPLRLPLVPRIADAVLARWLPAGGSAVLPVVPVTAAPTAEKPGPLDGGRPPKPPAAGGGSSCAANLLAVLAREGLIVFLFIGAAWQLLASHPIVRERHAIQVPEPFASVNRSLRLIQRWDVMAPGTPGEGVVVVDAVTVDGRHVDPLSLHAAPYTLRAPNFDLAHARGLGFDQSWVEYLARLPSGASWAANYRDAFKDYLVRLPYRTGRTEDALVSGDVYWISDEHPRWNEHEPHDPVKEKLFSF
jgi:hypothetical protein